MIFDWENYWALEYTSGPSEDLKYVDQIHKYYTYFYERNISVDMIPTDADFSQYKVIVAPVLYMVKEGMKEALEAFVKNGGILITTYMSGIVNEADNVHLGMPAATRNTYGEGAAYYVGTQMDAAGLAKVLDRAVSEVGVKAVIPETTGLEVTCRTSDDTRYYYVMNFKDEDQILPESLAGKIDLISGEVIPAGTVLKKWDVLVLQEAK